jgi:orotate phosphoribosyltransferase
MKTLNEAGAVVTNSHFVFASGRHAPTYINKDALYLHPKITALICQEMARPYAAQSIDVVAGPTIGGVILSQWVAYHVNLTRTAGETLSIYAEELVEGDTKKRIFKRGYDQFVPGKNVLVVEDLLTTGGSARQVVEAVRALGGNVLGLSVICNRGGVTSKAVGDVPLNALVSLTLDSYEESECPLCTENIPINTALGKGREYLAKKGLPVS